MEKPNVAGLRSRLTTTIASGLRLGWDAAPREFIAIALLVAVAGLVPPAMVWLAKRLVDLVVARPHGPGVAATIGLTVGALGVLAAGQRALGVFQSNRQDLFSERVKFHAELRFLEHAARVDLGYFDSPEWHDRLARASRDVGWRPAQLSYTTLGMLGPMVTLLGMLGILLVIQPLLVLLSAISVLPMFFIQQRINRKIYDFWFEMTPAVRERGYIHYLLTEPRWAKEIRAFGLADHFAGRFTRLAGDQLGTLTRLYATADRSAIISAVFGGLALTLAYALMAQRGLAGQLTAGDLTAGIGAIAAIAGEAGLIASSILMLDQHAAFLNDYFSFLALEPLLPVTAAPRQASGPGTDLVEFRNVTFTYPGSREPAVSDLSLTIRPGELLALVGENGAGKTSLVKLLLRFYDPESGSVSVGGVDIKQLDRNGLRSRVGVLFQDYATYELSLRESVTLGRVDRVADDVEVMANLEAARAGSVVRQLQRGLDSMVGRLFEGGHDLSTGEWQRLALARLLFRDADIWILDEPTAALDPEAEAGVFAELRDHLRDRIGIVISHRFSTVRIADRIAVLEGGRLAELGTHDELIRAGGRYARLFELQASAYQ